MTSKHTGESETTNAQGLEEALSQQAVDPGQLQDRLVCRIHALRNIAEADVRELWRRAAHAAALHTQRVGWCGHATGCSSCSTFGALLWREGGVGRGGSESGAAEGGGCGQMGGAARDVGGQVGRGVDKTGLRVCVLTTKHVT